MGDGEVSDKKKRIDDAVDAIHREARVGPHRMDRISRGDATIIAHVLDRHGLLAEVGELKSLRDEIDETVTGMTIKQGRNIIRESLRGIF